MRKIIIFCFLAFGISMLSQAQETALTSKGKVVILYDNGTWKYADLSVSDENQQIETSTQGSIPKPTISDKPLVLKEAEIEKTTFIEGPSPKLEKYFKDKNIVRCDFILSSKDGKASLKTEWKIMNGEAYSYFGFIKKDSKISLELLGGQSIDLIYTEEFEPKEFSQYGFSTYSAQLDLTNEQLTLLQNKIVLKATMNWSRRAEEYPVVAPSYFLKAIPQITE
ncbi:hypothetical protein BZG02_18920 [Labilibaculum filiforme]|uniref:DUF3157 domain-containing protein n=1 Tax=Labilibaculum filiforme TaxID=1940526 RepID=A0A2N3HR50_9BACT|nr:hypothetical protein [Labilibaculum filiforme]PKQ60538.1 hypothetical protein BZG02_18920 [Labilibaculum filiforme]